MKNKINNFMKLFVLVFTMTMGFFFTYAFVWFAFDLPVTKWVTLLFFALAASSMFGYYMWVREK